MGLLGFELFSFIAGVLAHASLGIAIAARTPRSRIYAGAAFLVVLIAWGFMLSIDPNPIAGGGG